MRWFGPSWNSPVCEEGEHVPTPVGEPCGYCHDLITEGQQGLVLHSSFGSGDWPIHLNCFGLTVLGEPLSEEATG
jgi:hypothetical protein